MTKLKSSRVCFFMFLLTFMFLPGNVIARTREQGNKPSNHRSSTSILRAQKLCANGKFNEALAVIDKLLQQNPRNAEALVCKGNVLGEMSENTNDMMKQAQYGMGAMQAFDQALRHAPNNVAARIGRGVSNLTAPAPFGNVDIAFSDLQKAVELAPTLVEAQFYLGVAYYKKGEIDKAKSAFQKTLLLDPDYLPAQSELKKMGVKVHKSTPSTPLQPPESFALTHVTVINITGKQSQSDMTVVVSDERITALGKTSKISIPEGLKVIDATGKFLIPGLWDMHTHIIGDPKWYFPLYLANGVTGIRYMHGSIPLEELLAIKEKISRGEMLGPRMIFSGPLIDGPDPFWPGAVSVKNATEGRQAVVDLKNKGADFIKVYSFLPREAYFAISEEAKKKSLPFAGHVPLLVSAFEASDAGQMSMEHLEGIYAAVSTHSERILELMNRGDVSALTSSTVYKEAMRDYDDEKAKALFSKFAKNNTWQVPTLSVFQGLIRKSELSSRTDLRLKYIPSTIKEFFGWQTPKTPNEDIQMQRHLKKSLEIVGEMNRAGVRIMAGTDSPYVNCFPGFTLHDELSLLADAGLSPLEVLQTATLNPAEYLDISNSLGTIEEGKIADFVLLEANPLEEISNTKRIAAVITNGRFLSKSDLKKMLTGVEELLANENPSRRKPNPQTSNR
ncbi:MAG: amidohydrolase family protein [Planctomycetes bacterium]|nr:amidohydrolase family protein [Planctomycetota bacterium]